MFNKNTLQQTFSFLAVGSMALAAISSPISVNADGGQIGVVGGNINPTSSDVNNTYSSLTINPVNGLPDGTNLCDYQNSTYSLANNLPTDSEAQNMDVYISPVTFNIKCPVSITEQKVIMSFTFDSSSEFNGATIDESDIRVRKYTNQWQDLTEAMPNSNLNISVTERVSFNLTTISISFNIADGGDGDVDNSQNGEIVDPIAVGVDFDSTPTSPFSDVKLGETFTGHIIALYNDGVIGGYSDGTFKPTGDVTRGAMAKFIYNAFEYTPNTSCGDFTDVSNSSGFYTYITTLKCEGVIGGYSDGSFKPSGKINRGATTKFIVNARRDKNLSLNEDTTNTPKFLDVSESNVFYEYIMMSRENNIIGGYSNNTFKPDDVVTRGAMSKIVDNGRKD
jgi:hypothetical protein